MTDTEQLWKKGFTLSYVIPRIGLKEALEAYRQAKEATEWTSIGKAFEQMGDHDRSLLDMGRELSDRSTRYMALRRTQQETVIRNVREGWLHAFGFQHPRRIEDKPIALPIDVWKGTVDWDKDTIQYDGLHFVAVRLVLKDHIDAVPPIPSKGRPSRKQHILDAYSALLQSGDVTENMTDKDLGTAIRAHIAQSHPTLGTEGLSPETIRRTVRQARENTAHRTQ